MKKKKILIITTAFPPENAVGSIRTSKITKYLVRNDFDVTVVSPKLNELTKRDSSLECSEFQNIKRVLISHSYFFKKFFFKRRNNMLKEKSATDYLQVNKKSNLLSSAKSQFYIFIHFFYTIIRNLDWYFEVKKKLSKEIKLQEIDIIISSYPSLSAHWISKNLKNKYESKWIADFRDPINYESNSNFILIKLNEIIQNSIIKKADFITFVSKEMIFKLNKNKKIKLDKFIYLPNGFDRDDISNIGKDKTQVFKNKLVLSYVGSLYGGKRDLDVIFKALKENINKGSLKIDNLIFNYAGSEFNIIEQQASKYNLTCILVNHGYVTREESIRVQNESDLNVVVTWNSKIDKGIMTGKIYESFLLGKKILGVVNGDLPNSEFKNVISRVNGGFVIENSSQNYRDDYNALKLFLNDNYIKKLETGKIESNYNDLITTYEYPIIVNEIIKLF